MAVGSARLNQKVVMHKASDYSYIVRKIIEGLDKISEVVDSAKNIADNLKTYGWK